MLVRVISYTFTDARIPGAGQQVYRLVTTLLDPFLYPARELAVLFHSAISECHHMYRIP